jgi:biopolymer transport protein ExbD
MGEINITPLTDVMMVLLIIFMVTTPLILKASVDINLPKVHAKSAAPVQLVQVTLTTDGKILVNGSSVRMAELGAYLMKLLKQEAESSVTVSADERIPYGDAVKVLDIARQAGATKLVLAAEPLPVEPLSQEITHQ